MYKEQQQEEVKAPLVSPKVIIGAAGAILGTAVTVVAVRYFRKKGKAVKGRGGK